MNNNFLWQDHSAYDSNTSSEICKLNLSKLVINVDGPGSDSSNPQCGPNIDQLTTFVSQLVKGGFKGKLVMHPDATKGDYEHDWNNKGNLPKRPNDESWMSYCDYFHEMNQALSKKGLPLFSEILIETEASYIPKTPEMFTKIRTYLVDTLKENASVSTTGDWNINRNELKVSAVYPQLYDMGYVSNILKGENPPTKQRANDIAKAIVDVIKTKPAMLNDPKVFFSFSYSFDDTDAPVFGASGRVWSKSMFSYFTSQFSKELSTYSGSNINTGVWHCSAYLSAPNSNSYVSKLFRCIKKLLVIIKLIR